jgi:hypothetical protein
MLIRALRYSYHFRPIIEEKSTYIEKNCKSVDCLLHFYSYSLHTFAFFKRLLDCSSLCIKVIIKVNKDFFFK